MESNNQNQKEDKKDKKGKKEKIDKKDKIDKKEKKDNKEKGVEIDDAPLGEDGKPIMMCGALKSPKDPRDFLYDARRLAKGKEVLPATYDMRVNLPPIRNQGSQGSCVAQSASCVKEYQERKDVCKINGYMSPQYIYNHRTNYPEEGMYGRDVMDILLNHGAPREQSFTYGGMNITKRPADIPQAVHDEAKNFRIISYARVNFTDGDNEGNLYNLKLCLKNNGPCMGLFPVYNYGSEFWNGSPGQDMIGGHAVALVGWNENGFIVRNSWGTTWGQSGYSTFKYNDYLARKCWEVWTAVDGASEDIVKPLPPTPNCGACVLL